MKTKALVLVFLLVSVIAVACTSGSNTGAYNPNPPQGQQNGQYVGGGCGVLPQADYTEPIQVSDSAL